MLTTEQFHGVAKSLWGWPQTGSEQVRFEWAGVGAVPWSQAVGYRADVFVSAAGALGAHPAVEAATNLIHWWRPGVWSWPDCLGVRRGYVRGLFQVRVHRG